MIDKLYRWTKASEQPLPSPYGTDGKLSVLYKGKPDIIKFNGTKWVWDIIGVAVNDSHIPDIEFLEEYTPAPPFNIEKEAEEYWAQKIRDFVDGDKVVREYQSMYVISEEAIKLLAIFIAGANGTNHVQGDGKYYEVVSVETKPDKSGVYFVKKDSFDYPGRLLYSNKLGWMIDESKQVPHKELPTHWLRPFPSLPTSIVQRLREVNPYSDVTGSADSVRRWAWPNCCNKAEELLKTKEEKL